LRPPILRHFGGSRLWRQCRAPRPFPPLRAQPRAALSPRLASASWTGPEARRTIDCPGRRNQLTRSAVRLRSPRSSIRLPVSRSCSFALRAFPMLATACGWVSPTPAGELESRLASPSNETRVAPEARLQRQRYPSWGALSSRGSRLVLSPALEGETLVSGWHEVAPPRRSWHVAVFDSRRNRLLLCGGAFHGTLWSYELVTRTWSEIPLTAPGPDLVGACGIYDPIRDRVVVFGGRNSYGDPSADTWVLDLRGAPQWTKLSATGLTPREEASAAYDPVGDRMIVFGGIRFVH